MADIATISRMEQDLVEQMAKTALEYLERGNLKAVRVTLESIIRIVQ